MIFSVFWIMFCFILRLIFSWRCLNWLELCPNWWKKISKLGLKNNSVTWLLINLAVNCYGNEIIDMKFYRNICDKLYWQKLSAKQPSYHIRLLLVCFSIFALFGYSVVLDSEGYKLVRRKKQLLNYDRRNPIYLTFEQIQKMISYLTLSIVITIHIFSPSSEDNHLCPVLRN